eukprot:2165101-Lingulodinium_polyedra.AAC.1
MSSSGSLLPGSGYSMDAGPRQAHGTMHARVPVRVGSASFQRGIAYQVGESSGVGRVGRRCLIKQPRCPTTKS